MNSKFDISKMYPKNTSQCATENKSINMICTMICKFLNESSKRLRAILAKQLRLKDVTVTTATKVTKIYPKDYEISISISSRIYLPIECEMLNIGVIMLPSLS